MDTKWFKQRKYRHFDRKVNSEFATKVMEPEFVSRHAFAPFIRYMKQTKRYKADVKKVVLKERPIMYASHKDACIFSYYSMQLNLKLEEYYKAHRLNESVLAYRSLKKANYDFSAEAYSFAVRNQPVTILAFDVTGFFDNLNHKILKERLKSLLGQCQLSEDWYKVYSSVTKYHFADLDDISKALRSGKLIGTKGDMYATVKEVKKSGVKFHPNESPGTGIPQGTPVSAALSNAYMIEFDRNAMQKLDGMGALYRRYSDDILVICKPEEQETVEQIITSLIQQEKLALNRQKTEVTYFSTSGTNKTGGKAAQYLGFTFDPAGASIRPASMARQWRKMRRAIRTTRNTALRAVKKGKSDTVYTKRLRERFSPLKGKNFSSYARRSSKAFDYNKQIKRQVLRFERGANRAIADLKNEVATEVKKIKSI